MKQFLIAIFSIIASTSLALAQSSPGWPYGYVPTAGQWNAAFAAKQDVLNYVPLNIAGGTLLGRLNLSPPNSSIAGLNIGIGVTPGSLLNGDLWATTTGLYFRNNGTTYLIGTGPSSGFTANLPLIGAGGGGIAQGTRSGNTTVFGTVSGTLTNGDCIQFDSFGNIIDSGAPCQSLTFGTGSNQSIIATSANTGFDNQFFIDNSGTATNSATKSTVYANLSGCVGCTTVVQSSGDPSNPFGTLYTDTGMTGGMKLIASEGNLQLFAPNGLIAANAKVDLSASSSGMAGINFGIGAAPGSPINGDIWNTSVGLFTQRGGSSYKIGTLNGATTNGDCTQFDATGNLVDSGAPCQAFTFGVGSNQSIVATSANTGFDNQLFINNSGTPTNSATKSTVYANLSGCSGCTAVIQAAGDPANPFGTFYTDTGMTGGMKLIANEGNLVMFAPNGRVTAFSTLGTGGYTVSTLPTAAQGDRAYVTDQLTACPVIGQPLAGSGTVVCPVFYNGSTWVSG